VKHYKSHYFIIVLAPIIFGCVSESFLSTLYNPGFLLGNPNSSPAEIYFTSIVATNVSSAQVESDNGGVTPNISYDGRYAVFASSSTNLVAGDTNGVSDIFLRDMKNGVTTRVSVDSGGLEANGNSETPCVSEDGIYVAFASDATNLVAGDTNGNKDIFLHNTLTGVTTRVSVDSVGTESNGVSWKTSITKDGRYIAFISDATNLVAGDTNANRDAFVHDA